MADPTKPYEGFGDPASRHAHVRARIQHLIDLKSKEPRLLDYYDNGVVDGLKLALTVIDGG